MGNSASMADQLPEIRETGLTTQNNDGPSYGKAGMSQQQWDTADKDATDGGEKNKTEKLSPKAPAEPDLDSPACLTDGSKEQIPRDYIQKWKINDGNKKQRMKEIVYTLDLLTSKPINELVTNAKQYERDFYLLSKGLYRVTNDKYENRMLVLETLLKADLMSFLKAYWKEVMAEFERKKKETDSKMNNGQMWKQLAEDKSHVVDALTNCYHMLVIVWNGSDMKAAKNLALMYNSTTGLILEGLDCYMFPIDNVPAAHPQHKAVKAFLGIIHNFCNKHDSSISDLREKNALRIIAKYRNSGADSLKAKTILACSYLLSEENDKEKSVIELGESDIKFLIVVLKDAMKSPDEHSKLYGYHAEELIVGLNNIAVIDSNKERLVDAGILPLYVEAMNRNKPHLQECAAHGIWTLAFDEKSKQKINDEPGCMDALRKLSKSSTRAVKEEANGALWKMEGETKYLEMANAKKVTQAPTTKKKLKHIMISYQWDVQEEVLRLRKRLKDAGYRVWIDVEQMHKSGDTLVAMAKAVENSAQVIPVLTDKYPASNACRQEITYANKLEKPLVPVRLQAKYRPEGWLSMLLAGVFFYDLTKPKEYEQKMADLIKSLSSEAKILPGEPEDVDTNDGNEVSAPITKEVVPTLGAAQDFGDHDLSMSAGASNIKTVFNVTQLKCTQWTKEQVADWFKSIGLEKYNKKFGGLDGRLLAELAAIQFISPDSYYQMVRQDHSMSMVDILKLNASLRQLNSRTY